jgi:hypothetical protein
MLFNSPNSFGWSASNFGATYTDTGIGTAVTSGAANTKGSTVSLLAGSSVTEDVYGIAIGFSGGFTAATIRVWLADIYFDPAGGTSWESTPRIANLIVNSPCLHNGAYWYYFPLYVKNNTSIGMSVQSNNATSALRGLVKVFGKPSRPEWLQVGSFVKTFGATTASSNGTTITPGTSAMGAYTASLATTANDLWWWQGGIAINDTTQTNVGYLIDIAAGDASNKVLVAENIRVSNAGTAEQSGKDAFGTREPIFSIKSGANVYMRAACSGTPDSSVTVAAYGLGG